MKKNEYKDTKNTKYKIKYIIRFMEFPTSLSLYILFPWDNNKIHENNILLSNVSKHSKFQVSIPKPKINKHQIKYKDKISNMM